MVCVPIVRLGTLVIEMGVPERDGEVGMRYDSRRLQDGIMSTVAGGATVVLAIIVVRMNGDGCRGLDSNERGQDGEDQQDGTQPGSTKAPDPAPTSHRISFPQLQTAGA